MICSRFCAVYVLAVVLWMASSVYSQPIPELEPLNNVPPGQPGAPTAPFWSAEGSLLSGDVDFYFHGPALAFPPGVPVMITAATFTAPFFTFPDPVPSGDTFIGTFDPIGGIASPVSTDDDDNPGANSSHHFTTLPGTPLVHGITGFPDFAFIGAHSVSAPFYRFVVSSGAPPESEFNGTIATANPLPAPIFGVTANTGDLMPGDVDYFSMPIVAGSFVTGSTFDFLPAGGPAVDTLLGVFDPSGALMGANDDDGPAFLSALAFVAPVTGVYSFAVTGFGDTDFDGIGHTEVGPYRLVVSVPEPAAVTVPIGLLALLCRSTRRVTRIGHARDWRT
jgi:hypothetical protein